MGNGNPIPDTIRHHYRICLHQYSFRKMQWAERGKMAYEVNEAFQKTRLLSGITALYCRLNPAFKFEPSVENVRPAYNHTVQRRIFTVNT
jgi:hypothetical protein